MEEEMISLSNIMPVELAIKRELEYRKKMESLNNHGQNEFQPLVLGQGSSTQASDIKLAPSSSKKVLPTLPFSSNSQSYQEKVAFSCKACEMTFATIFHLSSHIVGREHNVKISQMKKSRVAISNPIWCESCGSSCSSLDEMERHLKGSRHRSLDTDRTINRKRKKR
ncbi:uncharacterized protein [Rutidosis leptorrhynchoides]|uniref:uncharacterized protein isoform X2 n=1 Tax=Rutidosis leptorrhynchoides TaxID=125765 RepID=UPI003A991F3E